MALIYITRSAWQKAVAEVEFYANDPKGSKEAAMHAMFGFKRKDCSWKMPWEILDLSDIQYYLITHVWVPPRKYTKHKATSVNFVFKNEFELEDFKIQFNLWKNPLASRYPALDIGYIHSHQFATGFTMPSGLNVKGKTDYSRVYPFWQQMRNRGLDAVPEVIFCKSRKKDSDWEACSYIFDSENKFKYQGYIEIIPDDDPKVDEILCRSYSSLPGGSLWRWRQNTQLSDCIEHGKYNFGWQGFQIRYLENNILYVLLPPNFPNCNSVLYKTFNEKGNYWSSTKLWPKKEFGFRFQLRDLVDFVKVKGYER
jgi:hypothetical protein